MPKRDLRHRRTKINRILYLTPRVPAVPRVIARERDEETAGRGRGKARPFQIDGLWCFGKAEREVTKV